MQLKLAIRTPGGQFTVVDVDDGESLFSSNIILNKDTADLATMDAAVAGALEAIYGDFTFNSATGEWDYALDNADADTQALNDGETGTDTLTVQSVDGTQKTISVTVDGANDAPTIVLPSELTVPINPVTPEDTAISITGLSVGDVDNETLTVTLTASSTIDLASTTELTGLSGDGTNVVTFTGSAADINAALDGLTYTPSENVNDDNGTGQIVVEVTDNNPTNTQTVSKTLDISITAVNNAPEIAIETTNLITNGDFEADTIADGISATSGITGWNTTTESGVFNGNENHHPQYADDIVDNQVGFANYTNTLSQSVGVYQPNAVYEVSFDVFTRSDVTNSSVIDVQMFVGTQRVLVETITGPAKGSAETFTMTFDLSTAVFSTPPVPGVTDVEIYFGHGTGSNGQLNIDNVSVISLLTTNEDTALALNDIQVSDVDADETSNSEVEVTLAVDNGTISVGTAADVAVVGDGTGTVTMTGSLAAINVALAINGNVTYLGNLDYNGQDSLSITIDDKGNSGSGGAKTAMETIAIYVAPVNDAPELLSVVDPADATVGRTDGVAQDVSVAGSLNVKDVDVGDTLTGMQSGAVTATLNVGTSYGDVTLNPEIVALIANSTLSFSNTAAANGASQVLNYTFDAAAVDLDFLGSGQILELTYSGVVVGDGSLDSTADTIRVTLVGSNPDYGEVVEAGNAANGDVIAGTDVATGTVAIDTAQVDAGATWSGGGAGLYGDLVIDPTTGIWTYRLDNNDPATQSLQDGEVQTEMFVVSATDGSAPDQIETITVSVLGTNDAPVAMADTASVGAAYFADNGHFYKFVETTGSGTTWTDADAAASAMGGYLATLKSAGEQSFVATNISFGGDSAAYLGGVQTPNSPSQSANWNWIEGDGSMEPFSGPLPWANPTSLYPEPNDVDNIENNQENYLMVDAAGKWNDIGLYPHENIGYLVEFDAPPAIGPVEIDVLANDTDADTVTGLIISAFDATSAEGAAISESGGKLIYTPGEYYRNLAAGEIGTDTFEYTAQDEHGAESTQTVTVTLHGNYPAEFGGALSGLVGNGVASMVSGDASSTDVDNSDDVFIANAGNSTYGSFSVDVAGVWNYTPDQTDTDVTSLDFGSTLEDQFIISSVDGTMQTINITIHKGDQIGDDGDNVLLASVGETVNGLGGDDLITDNFGINYLFGGEGADTFILTNDAPDQGVPFIDEILDFEPGADPLINDVLDLQAYFESDTVVTAADNGDGTTSVSVGETQVALLHGNFGGSILNLSYDSSVEAETVNVIGLT